jgi:hypothetical protein
MQTGAAVAIAEGAPDGVDERCSRVEDAASVGEAPDPASGGGDAEKVTIWVRQGSIEKNWTRDFGDRSEGSRKVTMKGGGQGSVNRYLRGMGMVKVRGQGMD